LLPPFSAKAKGAAALHPKKKKEEIMPKYEVEFSTDAEFAMHEFEADTPELALQAARRIADTGDEDLDFEHYSDTHPIDAITVHGDRHEELCHWHSDDLRLRLAASDLLAAAYAVVDRWESGDLAAAVRELDKVITEAGLRKT
jgi:hypothetical protein